MQIKTPDFLRELFICSKAILEKERKVLRLSGISLSDYLILFSVYENQDRKMTDIAKELLVSRPVATYAVNRLVKRGLIKRSRSKSCDRRVVLLTMTPKAKSFLRSICKKQKVLLQNSFNELPDHVRKLVSDFMPQMKAFFWESKCGKRLKSERIL